MFRPAFIFVCVCFIMAGVGSWFAANQAVKQFEMQTDAEVNEALNAGGMDWARVRSNGLRVDLTGVAPTEIERFRALEIMAQIVDTDRIRDEVLVIPPQDLEPPRFSLEILRNEDRVSLIGLVPTADGTEQILDRISAITSDMVVTDMLETADHGVGSQWQSALQFGLDNLSQLPRSKISITEDSVTVAAITDSVEEQQTVQSRLARTKPDDINLFLDISAPRPVITPFRFRLNLSEEGAELLSCSSDTELTRQRILRAVSRLGVEDKLRCEIGLGVPTTDWPIAIEQGLEALQNLGGGSIAISDSDISLIATENASPERFEEVVGQLESSLPELFSLNAILPPKLSDNSDDGVIRPSELIADLDLRGTVQITGRIDNDVSRQSLNTVGEALFGSGQIQIDTLTDPDLPNTWAVRSMAALKALSELSEGQVIVQPEKIIVTGRSLNESVSSEIDRILATDLGGRGNYEINVRYDESLLPPPENLSDATCEAEIALILRDSQIVFDPGSVMLTEESEETLSLIAAKLLECPDTKFEIQGHTDSQGPDDLNLEISQSRAETVLSGLLDRRVLIGGLVAKGYGSSQPIASNETEDGRAANRRIEFKLPETIAAEAAQTADQDGQSEADNSTEQASEEDASEDATEESDG